MEELLLTIIGDALMMALAVFSIISCGVLIIKILKSQEIKDRKYTRKLKMDLSSTAYLRMKLGLIAPRSFIYGRKNIGNTLFNLQKLNIDDSYLTKNSDTVMNKEKY